MYKNILVALEGKSTDDAAISHAVKLAYLERHLRQNGCLLKRQGGAHAIWENPAKGAWTSVPRHREVKEHLARRICRQVQIYNCSIGAGDC